jgi:ElaB/YqjD/DUF883 family membrane-anchored ribosome-binding protein
MTQVFQTSVNLQEKLVRDIKATVAEAEDLLSVISDQAGEKTDKIRARIQNRLSDARERLIEAETALVSKTKTAAQATDAYVHESPWKAVGIAAGVGLLVGLLVARR